MPEPAEPTIEELQKRLLDRLAREPDISDVLRLVHAFEPEGNDENEVRGSKWVVPDKIFEATILSRQART